MAEMMDEVRPEMKVMLDEVKRIAQEHWLPYVDEFDALGGAQVKVRRQKEWLNFWNAFKDAGFFGFRIPKEYGGIGFGVGDFFMVVRDANPEAVLEVLQPYEGNVYYSALAEETEEELRKVLSDGV